MKTQLQPMVALTFDDGPSARYTPAILDILDQYDSSATFFILGTQVVDQEQGAELLSRMVDSGHEIGIHSYKHVAFTELTPEELAIQILTAQDVIQNATGYSAKIIRPPYGFINEALLKLIPFPIILWSMDTEDWRIRDAKIISDTLLSVVKDGDIILLHDIFESTVDAMKIVIPALLEKGFQLVTVSGLADARGVTMEKGKVYSIFPPIETS